MIDTLDAKNAGFTDEQIKVLKQADTTLVSKDYLDAKLAPLDIQIKISIALGIAIFLKSFF